VYNIESPIAGGLLYTQSRKTSQPYRRRELKEFLIFIFTAQFFVPLFLFQTNTHTHTKINKNKTICWVRVVWVSSTKKEKKSGRQRRRRSEAARVYVISDNKWGPRGRVPVPRSLAAITAIQFIYLYILHPKYIYTYFHSGILSGKNYKFFCFCGWKFLKIIRKRFFRVQSDRQMDGPNAFGIGFIDFRPGRPFPHPVASTVLLSIIYTLTPRPASASSICELRAERKWVYFNRL
jgi:hypothetical protein